MFKIEAKRIPFFIFIFAVVLVISSCGNKINELFNKQNDKDEYELIRKHLLEDSALGGNKPKLWIHSKYSNKSGICKYSKEKSSTDLECPYIKLVIESIVQNNHDDFHICLIDDDSFSKLIPDWDIQIDSLSDPIKTNYRQFGLMSLLHDYGGIVVPNSFLCMKSLKSLFEKCISESKPFVCENVNDKSGRHEKLKLIPDIFMMGSKKNDLVMKEMMEYQAKLAKNPHFTSENIFLGTYNSWCLDLVKSNKLNLIGGEIIGVKTLDKVLSIDDLMEDQRLSLHENCVGIYIPHDEIIKRIKYQWFAKITGEEVLKSKTVIANQLKLSIKDVESHCHILNSKTIYSSI